jgi:RND family efflux transporter MFP subunit
LAFRIGSNLKKILSVDIELIGSVYLSLRVVPYGAGSFSASIALARNWDMNMNLLRFTFFNRIRKFLFTIAGAMVIPAITGCGNKESAAIAPPPAAVTVAHPVSRDVVEWDTYTGHLESPELVNVEARVSGLIVSAPFVEGSIVKKGDLLYEIDERPFKADLDARIADEQKAEAAEENAKLTYDRVKGLEDGKAVSQQDVDDAKGNYDQATAAVAAARAAIESARLNLEWCKVTSPIDGRISNKLVNVGNLVNGGEGQATMLTTVVSISPMYCYVDIDELSVLKYQKLVEEKKRVSSRDGKLPCWVQLSDEGGYPYSGYIDFQDNHVDPATGTLRARGVLENKDGLLTPGFFARLRIPGSARYQTLLVPDTAIGNDQNQHVVLVVNKDNVVEPRVVQTGAVFGNLRSVVSGIGADDWVITKGLMHARPGSAVAPTQEPIHVDESAFLDVETKDTRLAMEMRRKENRASTQPSGEIHR